MEDAGRSGAAFPADASEARSTRSAMGGSDAGGAAGNAKPVRLMRKSSTTNVPLSVNCTAARAAGVMASKLHRPNHLHSVFAPYRRPLPGLDLFYRKLLHIPCGWWVTLEQRQMIAHTIAQG